MQVIVINRPVDVDRKKRIIERLEKRNLLEHFHIIPADDNTEEFKTFIKGVEHTFDERQIRVAGSLLSHIKAYRYFFEESECSECIILEDDAMLHKDFRAKLADMISHRPAGCECILLAPYCCVQMTYDQQVYPGLFNHFSGAIFGASCYWFTKNFAKRVLEEYDRPMIEYPNFSPCLTSENVIHNIGACITIPPLAIEESIDTNLQPQSHLPGKKTYWNYYGFENYE